MLEGLVVEIEVTFSDLTVETVTGVSGTGLRLVLEHFVHSQREDLAGVSGIGLRLAVEHISCKERKDSLSSSVI